MSNFDHLKALKVAVDTIAEYPIHHIKVNGKFPVLLLSPATDANKPYFNAVLKRASKSAAALRAGAVSAEMLDENREEDRELYPVSVLKGWRDMCDGETGKDIPFSVSEATAFLAALPNWLFDDMRAYAANPANFTELMDVEVQVKNS